MFLKAFKTMLIEKRSLADFGKYLDKQHVQIGEKQELEFRQELKRIMEVRDYKSYYAYQGKPIKDDTEMKALLTQALKNSAEKKYHGKEEDLNAIPCLSEQVEDLQ